ncbi:MAG: methylenetetrahydrofolate reductase [Bacillota bacterium]|nr:methylenetetrahydrofolate reductase [Bacillota bacterium]
MRAKERFIMVEVKPPKNGDMAPILKIIADLKEKGVTSITFPDRPGGIPRADAVLTAVKVKDEINIDVVPHVACSGRDRVLLRSLLLGAHANGIRNMFFVSGAQSSVNSGVSSAEVSVCSSLGLMELASDLNRFDLIKNPLRIGGTVNYKNIYIDEEIKLVRTKMEQGALFFFSHPVYTEEDVETVRQIAKSTGANIYCSVMPAVSKKNAEFIRYHYPNVNIPEDLIERFNDAMTIEEAEYVGLANAKKMLGYMDDFTYGYHFAFPFNRTYLLDELLPLLRR